MTKEVVHRNALPKGSQLNEYVIEKVLGEPGGFGVAYLARDVNLDQLVAIKEYLPNDLAMREGTTVYPKSTHDEEDFTWGLDRFLDEARTLAKFKHPNIVQVLRYFKANNTGYMVMSYEDGKPLNEILKENHLNEDELVQNILLPLIDGLKQVHAAGFLHRDIKPGNIYMRRSDETPVLLDFGAARNALGSKSKSLTSIVTPGYAPFEQYHSDGNQGAWSDIYALGAVAYRIVTGKRPPEAPSRIRKDKMVPAVEAAKGKYSEKLLRAIDHALAVDEEDRPQSCVEWKKEITEKNHAELALPTSKTDESPINDFESGYTVAFKLSNKHVFLTPIYCAILSFIPFVLPLLGINRNMIELFVVGWLISIPLGSLYGFRDFIHCPVKKIILFVALQVGYFSFCDVFISEDFHVFADSRYIITVCDTVPIFYSEIIFTIALTAGLFFGLREWKKICLFAGVTLSGLYACLAYFHSLPVPSYLLVFLTVLFVFLGIKMFLFNAVSWFKWMKVITVTSVCTAGWGFWITIMVLGSR